MKIKRSRSMNRKCPKCGFVKNYIICSIEKHHFIKKYYCSNCKSIKEITKYKLKENIDKYRYLFVDGKQKQMHRVVYEMVHNVKLTPFDIIHHIDSVKSNNLPSNLLLASHHNPMMHKNHPYFKVAFLKKRIKELEAELEECKKKNL